ncbi:hypothetical protein QCA50_004800 [Cerrena zonata]|uniref:Uncharacterized protein n=1 Tax=Cerrena zonata TaxID=2478898 RepID=A0AAW0GDE4_9APHY
MHFPKLPIFRNKKAGPLVKPRCLHVVVDRNGNIIAQSNNIVDINVPSLRQFDALLYYGDVPADKRHQVSSGGLRNEGGSLEGFEGREGVREGSYERMECYALGFELGPGHQDGDVKTWDFKTWDIKTLGSQDTGYQETGLQDMGLQDTGPQDDARIQDVELKTQGHQNTGTGHQDDRDRVH